MNKPKLTPQIIADLVEYASGGMDGMFFTDLELFEAINEQLPAEMKVCYRTFQRYKAKAMQQGDVYSSDQQGISPIYTDVYHAFVRNGMRQKQLLVREMLDAEGNKWMRYKWLLEKKFPEFNQGCIMEKFRREQSYLDEDYPSHRSKNNRQPQPEASASPRAAETPPIATIEKPTPKPQADTKAAPITEPAPIATAATSAPIIQKPAAKHYPQKPQAKKNPNAKNGLRRGGDGCCRDATLCVYIQHRCSMIIRYIDAIPLRHGIYIIRLIRRNEVHFMSRLFHSAGKSQRDDISVAAYAMRGL